MLNMYIIRLARAQLSVCLSARPSTSLSLTATINQLTVDMTAGKDKLVVPVSLLDTDLYKVRPRPPGSRSCRQHDAS